MASCFIAHQAVNRGGVKKIITIGKLTIKKYYFAREISNSSK